MSLLERSEIVFWISQNESQCEDSFWRFCRCFVCSFCAVNREIKKIYMNWTGLRRYCETNSAACLNQNQTNVSTFSTSCNAASRLLCSGLTSEGTQFWRFISTNRTIHFQVTLFSFGITIKKSGIPFETHILLFFIIVHIYGVLVSFGMCPEFSRSFNFNRLSKYSDSTSSSGHWIDFLLTIRFKRLKTYFFKSYCLDYTEAISFAVSDIIRI